MMITADNDNDNADNDNNVFTANSNTHVNSIDNNLHDYSSFDMCLVSNYTNNQFIYYYISDIISAAEQAHFQQLMKQHKTSLEILEWNDVFDDDNNEFYIFEKFIISVIKNNNFDYSAFLSDYKSIKINMSNISKLTYNSTIA